MKYYFPSCKFQDSKLTIKSTYSKTFLDDFPSVWKDQAIAVLEIAEKVVNQKTSDNFMKLLLDENLSIFSILVFLKKKSMSSAELKGIKLNLITWINELSDADLITFLDGLRISRAKSDWWEELSISQKKQVLAGLKDAENGRVMDSKEFWKSLGNA